MAHRSIRIIRTRSRALNIRRAQPWVDIGAGGQAAEAAASGGTEAGEASADTEATDEQWVTEMAAFGGKADITRTSQNVRF